MNQPINPQFAQPPAPAYKDRGGWLVAFGVFEILIACFFLFMTTVTALLVPSLPRPAGQPAVPGTFFYFLAAIYAGFATYFVAVGIGSIRARNWARAAMVVTSSLWLVIGVISTISTIFLMPRIMQQQRASMPPEQASQLPPNFESIVVVVTAIFTAFIMVVLPLVLLLFYSSKNVKRTCHARSGVVASTSRLPIPVIILIIWFSFVGLSALAGAAFFPLSTLFGFVIHGTAARVIGLAFFAVSAYCAWNLYKLRLQGWIVSAVAQGTWIVSGVITAVRLNAITLIEESYRSMGMSPEQIANQSLDVQSVNLFWWLGVLLSGALLGLILYTKRYFKPDQRQPKGLAAGA
ncbi:MAG: hypothetical protein L0Z53_07795 [Acidobacteriales bacterium]|nr:hypothetical protein [Terriglobales bacterium]